MQGIDLTTAPGKLEKMGLQTDGSASIKTAAGALQKKLETPKAK